MTLFTPHKPLELIHRYFRENLQKVKISSQKNRLQELKRRQTNSKSLWGLNGLSRVFYRLPSLQLSHKNLLSIRFEKNYQLHCLTLYSKCGLGFSQIQHQNNQTMLQKIQFLLATSPRPRPKITLEQNLNELASSDAIFTLLSIITSEFKSHYFLLLSVFIVLFCAVDET